MNKPNFDFTKKIEDMSPEQMTERIRAGYEYKHEHKLVPIPYIGSKGITVKYKYPELIGLCPATGYPDTYELKIIFTPDKVIPELKSLKFYLVEYMNLPISHEHLASKIKNDFVKAIKPKSITVELKTAVRGGIYTDIIA